MKEKNLPERPQLASHDPRQQQQERFGQENERSVKSLK